MALATSFLQELDRFNSSFVCALCALGFPLTDCRVMSVASVQPSGQTLFFPGVLSANRQSLNVCPRCSLSVARGITPLYALNSKWGLSPVPSELAELTLLEKLLITKHFRVLLQLNSCPPDVGRPLYSIDAVSFPDKSSFYKMDTLPLSPAHLLLVFQINMHLLPGQCSDSVPWPLSALDAVVPVCGG